jgi:hypothetical protein
VIAVDLAASTSRDVSGEIARKVDLAATIEQRTLADGAQAFVEAQRSAAADRDRTCNPAHAVAFATAPHQYAPAGRSIVPVTTCLV